MNEHGIYIEISLAALRVLQDDRGLEVPVERAANGRLTEPSRARVVSELREFLKSSNWHLHRRGYCAIGARGVSLRRVTVPSVSREEARRLLLMQIESEFPLGPDELAWGSQVISETRHNGSVRQELVVVAVRKEVVEEYAALLGDCGLSPVFTLAALARGGLSSDPRQNGAVLDVTEHGSELALFEQGIPIQIRTLPLVEGGSSAEGLEAFAKNLNGTWSGKKLLVSGSDDSFRVVCSCLTERFTSGIDCEALSIPRAPGRTSATLGLKRAVESGGLHLIFLQTSTEGDKHPLVGTAPVKWAVAAAALVLAFVLLPYAEALVMKPRLEKRLAALKKDEGRLEIISRKLEFLQHLKQSQPPYLDALYLFSKSAPSGAKIESMTLNRRGEVSLRGAMRNADQVGEFRNKLIASGFFSAVTVEEQSPTPDRQRLNVRITCQWKTSEALKALAIGPTQEEIDKAMAKKDSSPGGMPGMPAGFPGGMPSGPMPPGMPPGMPTGVMPPGAIPAGAMPAGLPPGIRISTPTPETRN